MHGDYFFLLLLVEIDEKLIFNLRRKKAMVVFKQLWNCVSNINLNTKTRKKRKFTQLRVKTLKKGVAKMINCSKNVWHFSSFVSNSFYSFTEYSTQFEQIIRINQSNINKINFFFRLQIDRQFLTF